MSKAMYLGVDGVARKVSKPYVGVDGVARKCKTGYVGVDGTARQFLSGASKITVTVTVNGKNAGSGIAVYGITDEAGNAVKTNSSGVAVGVTEAASVTVSTKEGYTDAADVSETVAVNGDTAVTLALTSKSGSLDVLSNKTVKLSAAVTTVKVLAVGGGGGGGAVCHSERGGQLGNYCCEACGGVGGSVVNNTISLSGPSSVVCTVGSGGSGGYEMISKSATGHSGSAGGNGGNTTVKTGGKTVAASGGAGGKVYYDADSGGVIIGTGDGAGRDGTAVTEFSTIRFGAAGGRSYWDINDDSYCEQNGGEDGGGASKASDARSGSYFTATAASATANYGSGGGGATAKQANFSYGAKATGGNGGSGRVMLKW